MTRNSSEKPKSRAPVKVSTTVTKANLKALGADRLADLLVELAEQDASLSRRLRMALTAVHAKDKLDKEIEKGLRTIQRSKGFLPWERQVNRDPAIVVTDILMLLDHDGYGTCDHLPASSGAALGETGSTMLRNALLLRLRDLPASKGKRHHHTYIARMQTIGHLLDLADVMGDVDAYIEAINLSDCQSAYIGNIARRLMDKGRHREAIAWRDRETNETPGFRRGHDDLRIEAC